MKLKVGDIVRRTDKYDREHPGTDATSKLCVVTSVKSGDHVEAEPLLFESDKWLHGSCLVQDAWEVVGHIEATPLREAHPIPQVESDD